MSSTSAVMVSDLGKSYPGVTAVDGIDLDIGHGEVFALLGPNGAGKPITELRRSLAPEPGRGTGGRLVLTSMRWPR